MKKLMRSLPGVLLVLCLIATPAAAAEPGDSEAGLAGGWWSAIVDFWELLARESSAVSATTPTTDSESPSVPDGSLRAFPEWDPDTARLQVASDPSATIEKGDE